MPPKAKSKINVINTNLPILLDDIIEESNPIILPKAKPKAKAKTSKKPKVNNVVFNDIITEASDIIEEDDVIENDIIIENSSNFPIQSENEVLSQKYQKLEHKKHVLQRSDNYVGKKTLHEGELYVFEDNMIVKREVKYVPALYKIFDECLINARDHVERMHISEFKQSLLKRNLKIDDNTITLDAIYRPVKKISVTIDPDQNLITITNDGNGLDVVLHPQHNIYIPELIFFNLLSGSNFDDNQERTWGGKNGIGAKAISIFSTECTIETVDSVRKKKYIQTCHKNMDIVDPPSITTCRSAPYTKFSFKPDLAELGIPSLASYDHMELFKKRVYDIAACTDSKVSVTLNGDTLPIRDFGKYVDLYLGSKKVAIKPNDCWEVYVGLSQTGKFEQVSFVNGINTYDGGKHVDHVTNILVNKLVDAIIESKKQLKDIKKKPSMVKNLLSVYINATIVNPEFNNQMKEALTTSIKDFPTKLLGKSFTLDEASIKPLLDKKIGLIDGLIAALTNRDQRNFENSGRNLERDMKTIPAEYAGTAKWADCILILTEGDSARTMAVSGLEALNEEAQKYIGIMPLKGKLINAKTSTLDKVLKNEEFLRLLKNMGLKPTDRECKGKLNYGHIAVLTDADHDGYHIKGLLFNMFHKFWPSLLKRPRFFLSIRTPIVSTINKRTGEKRFLYTYLDWEDWKNLNRASLNNYRYRYHKGLGTHDPEESREIFENLQYVEYVWNNDLTYQWLDIKPKKPEVLDDIITEEGDIIIEENDIVDGDIEQTQEQQEEDESESVASSDDSISDSESIGESSFSGGGSGENLNENCFKGLKNVQSLFQGGPDIDYCDISLKLAFENKDNLADYRKDWILKCLLKRSQGQIDYQFQRQNTVSYFNFVNSELIEFSIEDVQRSLPNIMDGFKPSQRKIMYRCLKRPKPFSLVRVDQLSGDISQKTNYHHGNESLIEAIVWTAQNFVGTNNINLLVPKGGFGSRLGSAPKDPSKSKIGKDHAAARYLSTCLTPIVPLIFNDLDTPLLKRVEDEGKFFEPHFYLPTIPLILINGSKGIGTGFSTSVPNFNPVDVIKNMERYIAGEVLEDMTPYYHGFKGKIERISSHRFKITGCYQIDRVNNTLTITELPAGSGSCMSYTKYQAFLYRFLEKEVNNESKSSNKSTTSKRKKKDKPDIVESIEAAKLRTSLINFVIKFKPGKIDTYTDEQIEKLFRLRTNISTSNMNLYTPEGILKHYNSAENILSDFMKYRLKWYESRRLYYLNKLLEECEFLLEKARFIGLEIDDNNEFTIRKKDEDQVVQLLKAHQFQTETEIKSKYNGIEIDCDEENNEDDNDDIPIAVKASEYKGYNYLVKMHIDYQTSTRIQKLNEERQKKLKEIEEYKQTTASILYTKDLGALRVSYMDHLTAWNQMHISDKNNQDKVKTKGAVMKRPRAKKTA